MSGLNIQGTLGIEPITAQCMQRWLKVSLHIWGGSIYTYAAYPLEWAEHPKDARNCTHYGPVLAALAQGQFTDSGRNIYTYVAYPLEWAEHPRDSRN